MVVVMPAGHTRTAAGSGRVGGRTLRSRGDFLGSVVPYAEKRYRVVSGRENTAIAGLSMGGGQTLDIATSHLDKFGYVGVFSSGLFGVFVIPGPRHPAAPAWSKGSSEWEKRQTLRRSLTSRPGRG